MSKEINGCYSYYDHQWLKAVAGKCKVDFYEWDNLLSNAMANRILDRITELEAWVSEAKRIIPLQLEQSIEAALVRRQGGG